MTEQNIKIPIKLGKNYTEPKSFDEKLEISNNNLSNIEDIQNNEELDKVIESNLDKYEINQTFFKDTKERFIFSIFIMPPIAISIVSMIHMFSLFQIYNEYWMSVAISVSIELAAIASLIGLAVLSKLNKTTVWLTFSILAILQVVGNCYSVVINSTSESLLSLYLLLNLDSNTNSLRLVSFLIGGILPLLSLLFTKSAVEYLHKSQHNITNKKD